MIPFGILLASGTRGLLIGVAVKVLGTAAAQIDVLRREPEFRRQDRGGSTRGPTTRWRRRIHRRLPERQCISLSLGRRRNQPPHRGTPLSLPSCCFRISQKTASDRRCPVLLGRLQRYRRHTAAAA